MTIIIGSARHDESGRYVRGKPGDQLQGKSPDFMGEVSMQTFYNSKKGWNIIRAKDATIANKIAANMKAACNNVNLGYSQDDRYGVITNGINAKKPTNCDCSSLVRACVKEATGKDPGDFTTVNAVTKLNATKLFEKAIPYTPSIALYTGDILCTKIKGHIVVVTDGNDREVITVQKPKQEVATPAVKQTVTYFPRYTGTSVSLVDALNSLSINSSMACRKIIASKNGINNYNGTAQQNQQLLTLLKRGRLISGKF